jgi:hypothetical protein
MAVSMAVSMANHQQEQFSGRKMQMLTVLCF